MDQNILNELLGTQSHLEKDELDAYLRNEATPAQRHKVENAMLDDPLYADAVEGYQEMGMSNLPALEDFSDFKKKLPTTESAKVVAMTQGQKLMRLAAVAIVLVLAWVGYNALQPATPDTLFSEFYTHYKNDISLTRRGDTVGMNQDFKNALGQYSVGEFAIANEGFKKAIEAEPDNVAAHFFSGMACLETNDLGGASKHLDIVKNSNSPYARKAFWYSILATLKAGDAAGAKKMLQEFVHSPGYKSKEAKMLLRDI